MKNETKQSETNTEASFLIFGAPYEEKGKKGKRGKGEKGTGESRFSFPFFPLHLFLSSPFM
jgi:hypothetical protein